MTMMNQAHRRFVPAYNSMKACLADSVRQCCYRYSERIRADDTEVQDHIRSVLGNEDGDLVINALSSDQFDEAILLELTASSPLANRESDRQNSLLLMNMLIQFYERIMQLAIVAANPQVPPEIKSVAGKIANGSNEIMDRTIRTFDQVRDPGQFLIDINEEFDKLSAGTPDQRGQLMQLIQGLDDARDPCGITLLHVRSWVEYQMWYPQRLRPLQLNQERILVHLPLLILRAAQVDQISIMRCRVLHLGLLERVLKLLDLVIGQRLSLELPSVLGEYLNDLCTVLNAVQ